MERSAGTVDAGVVLDVADTLSVGCGRRESFYGFHDLLIDKYGNEKERKATHVVEVIPIPVVLITDQGCPCIDLSLRWARKVHAVGSTRSTNDLSTGPCEITVSEVGLRDRLEVPVVSGPSEAVVVSHSGCIYGSIFH